MRGPHGRAGWRGDRGIAAARPGRRGNDDRHRRAARAARHHRRAGARHRWRSRPGVRPRRAGARHRGARRRPRPDDRRRPLASASSPRTRGDAGLTGAAWYGTGPVRDRTVRAGADPAHGVRGFLTHGWGHDGAPDLLAVALDGSTARDDRVTSSIVAEVLRAVPDATLVVTATGSLRARGRRPRANRRHRRTHASRRGGAFLDRVRHRSGDRASDAVDVFRTQTGAGRHAAVCRRVRVLRGAVREVLLMATRTQAPPRAPASPSAAADRTWVWMICGLTAIAILARVAHPMQIAWLRNLLIVFGSLLIEAHAVRRARRAGLGDDRGVRAGVVVREARAGCRAPLQLPAAALAGIAFPVCECGSVPVARRLARKGLSPAAAVTFMLAAPIVNPVVIASTYVAYRGRDALWLMVGRTVPARARRRDVRRLDRRRAPARRTASRRRHDDEPDDDHEPGVGGSSRTWRATSSSWRDS